jgi:hypothetical protein
MAKKNVKVTVDTDKVDIEIKKDEESKEFKLDSDKLDVHVKQDEKGTEVVVEAESSFMKKIGNFISRIFVKKFYKK